MTVVPSTFLRSASDDAAGRFRPSVSFRFPPEVFDYTEEEWIAQGAEPGGSYATIVLVRLPRDRSRFSGTVVVEPLHFSGIAPIALYSSTYLMRSGHGWAMVGAQRTTLDHHVKPHDPDRYAPLHIDGPEGALAVERFDAGEADRGGFWDELARWNRASSAILAQVGAAIGDGAGPFDGVGVRHLVLAGHSQTGRVVGRYLREAHSVERRPDGSSVYDGYFPSGFPFVTLPVCEVPVVQVVSEGDVSDPDGTFMPVPGRPYRRPDSDDPRDRFRLFELAGVPHMGTRHPPFDDVQLWRGVGAKESLTDRSLMSSLPHNELFDVTLDHLVRWVVDDTPAPRAPRLETAADGRFVADEHGNTRGGVRCVQMDVPRARYFPNVPNADGTLSHATIGTEEPFTAAKLKALYGDAATYRDRFERRLADLVTQGWLLEDDVEYMRDDLAKVHFD